MTAKEKAKELVEKYTKIKVVVLGCGKEEGNPCIIEDNINQIAAKQCTIIAVDEIINELKREPYTNYEIIVFWKALKTELNKL